MKKTIIEMIICFIVSTVLSFLFNYKDSTIIKYDVIINIEIALFSVSLAIVTLIITILDKYKEKTIAPSNWASSSSKILKEISENTLGLLVLTILISISAMLEPLLVMIPKFDAMTSILLFSFIVSLIIMTDTSISIFKLVIGLKDSLSTVNSSELNMSQKEIHLIEAYRFLDDDRKKSFEDLLKAMATNQQVESDK